MPHSFTGGLAHLLSAFIMAALKWIGQSKRLRGELTISRRHQFFGWAATLVMAIAVVLMGVTSL